VAHAVKLAGRMPKNSLMLVNLSGRGDKDLHTVSTQREVKRFQ
jgi:tryptophan synthase beta chain